MSSLSSVHSKLRINAGPTKEVAVEVELRKAVDETLKKLKVVEIETAHLQDRLIVLCQRKQATERLIEVYQGLIAPIRRLAPEILQEIFWRCLPTAHNSVLSFREAPLVLGRVCSQWRQIAYSTPKLWTSLHIAIVPLICPRARARFDAFDAWVARSGMLPLSISMSHAQGSAVSTDIFRPYFDLIFKHARRWKYLHLHVAFCDRMMNSLAETSGDSMNFLMEIFADDIPLLESFHIDVGVFGDHSILDQSLSRRDGILCAPLLRVLSVTDFSMRLLDLPVQWSLLTGLDLVHSHLPDIYKVLTLCFNLETCVVHVGIPINPFLPTTDLHASNSRPDILLSTLRTLKIIGGFSLNNDPLTLLNNLSTPALRHFAYEHLNGPRSSPTEFSSSLKVFRSFFQRLNKPLEELDLANDGLTTRYLMEFLSLFPNLKRLSLRSAFDASRSSFNDRLLLRFIPSTKFPSAICLCPNLEVLSIGNAILSKHILLDCLRSRLVDYDKHNVTRLRRFSISFKWKLEDQDMTEEIDWLAEVVICRLRPGSKAPAQAWLTGAQACLCPRPSPAQGPKAGSSRPRLRPGLTVAIGTARNQYWQVSTMEIIFTP